MADRHARGGGTLVPLAPKKREDNIVNLTTFLMTLLGIAVGMLGGTLLYAWWLRREASDRLRRPSTWPLKARGIVTNQELNVWKWLRSTFPDHMVMVKLPVLRFTIPLERLEREGGKDPGERWLELLNGVYTTFTICATDGKVVGCVDVPGKRGFNQASRDMKESLLSDCGIPFIVVYATHLPAGEALRAAFLGEMAGNPGQADPDEQETRIDASRFNEELGAFTQQRVRNAKDAALQKLNKDSDHIAQADKARNIGFSPDGTGTVGSVDTTDRFAMQWDDSFIQPLDTRPAKLD